MGLTGTYRIFHPTATGYRDSNETRGSLKNTLKTYITINWKTWKKWIIELSGYRKPKQIYNKK
jgi:hypothetical protein